MLYDIDKRLDMSLHFSTPITSFVLSTIVKENPVPINIYSHNKEMYATFFLSQISTSNRVMFETLNPILMGDTIVITEKIDNPVVRTLSENTGMISTLADGELYTKGKSVYASFRFHSSQLKGAANLLKTIVSLDYEVSDIGLHTSVGIEKVLDGIGKRIPLSVVMFSFSKPSGKKFVLEWRNLHRDPSDSIMYGLDGDETVERYSMLNEPTLSFLESIDRDHIPLGSYLEFHGLERVEAVTYVPSFLVKSLLVRLFGSTEGLKDFKIESIMNYSHAKELAEMIPQAALSF
jgi:hypothetical protein